MTTILLIDDVVEVLKNVSELLEFEGFDVIKAGDGIEGLQLAREHMPDLIICDIKMPGLNGYDVIKQLRSDIATATIPFIFLSANAMPEHIREGMVLGADDYLTKPFTGDQLMPRIWSRLKRHELYELQQLRSFAHQMVTIQEAERENLSYDLKNNLATIISDLKLTLDLLDRLPDRVRKSTLETSQALLDEVLREINVLSHTLYPTTLNQLGILPEIFFLIEQFKNHNEIDIAFEHQGIDSLNFNQNAKVALYRVVQEALNNIEKHAQSQHIDIRIWTEDEQLRLQIIDDGQGFDLEKALQDHRHIGIIGMRERVFLLNGEFSILTSPNDGTQVIADIPLNADIPDTQAEITRPLSQFQVKIPKLEHYIKPDAVNQQRVLIAESNELTRWGIHNAVNSNNTYNVVAMTDNEQELMQLLDETPVDMLILSHTLQAESDNMTLVEELHQQFPDVQIIILSNFAEYTYATDMIRRGASGYLLKSGSLEEMSHALNIVTEGKQYIAKDAMATVPTSVDDTSQPPTNLDAFSTLTEREREIFLLVVNGATNKVIAEQLYISSRTVETHRRNMMRKLGIRGTQNLMRFAMIRGLI